MSETTIMDVAELERLRAERLAQMELFDDHRFATVDVALSGSIELRRDIDADRELLDGLTLGEELDATLDNGYVLRFTVTGRAHRLKFTADGESPVAKTTLMLEYVTRPIVEGEDDEAEF